MSLAVSAEHAALADSVRRWAERAEVTRATRAAHDDADDALPASWAELGAQDLLGLAVAEEHGGSAAGVATLAVAIEELGRALAPGPYVPTVLAGLLVERHGSAAAQAELLPRLVAGELPAGVAIGGRTDLVLGGGTAALVVVPVDGDWYALDAASLTRRSEPGIDPSRRVARMDLTGAELAAERRLDGLTTDAVDALAGVLLAAEAAGIAGWCLDTAVTYATVREQFGRPIGAFQAVKHRCADMLTRVELARAAAWDAAIAVDDGVATDLAAAIAVAVAVDASVEVAKSCIQVHGGIGYTWEHDAHLYLKRALAVRQLLGGTSRWRRHAARLVLGGATRPATIELPAEAEGFRSAVRELLATLGPLDERERRRRIADAGYVVPHWPRPWGRGADPVEQVVVEQEFAAAGVAPPNLVIGGWALPPIVRFGTPEQQERFVRPTLHGDIVWCQMFSEPGAGSDLASLQTKAVRVDGGWSLSGQKVWTSLARRADWAICLARTNADAPKHQGITYFLVDMRTPGLDVRPLRELTGESLFNEIFLTDVFVPDDCVVGEVDGGWKLARTTLANERVAMSGSGFGGDVGRLLDAVRRGGHDDDDAVLDRVGGLLCTGRAEALLALRTTLHQVSGTDPGATSSVRKLVAMHHRQDTAEATLELLGPAAVSVDDDQARAAYRDVLSTRQLTIAGGTSEILRNIIGERILGLPRDSRGA